MTLLGGLGTVFGPVVGAFLLITIEHYLAQLGAWVTIVQGVIFVICVLAFRRGVVGELARLIRKAAVIRGGPSPMELRHRSAKSESIRRYLASICPFC